jgi:hypothetical protein
MQRQRHRRNGSQDHKEQQPQPQAGEKLGYIISHIKFQQSSLT